MIDSGTLIRIGGTIIGRVRGDTFHKRIHKGFYLFKPYSIFLDLLAITDAQKAGADKAQVRDMDSGTSLTAPLALILKKGVRFENGHRVQVALAVKEWTEVVEMEMVGT